MSKLYTFIITTIIALIPQISVFSQCYGGDPSTNAPSWDYSLTIEENFNAARRWEENNLGLAANCLGDMTEPNVGWNGMNEESTVLYIHNSERVARGKLPLYDVESNLDGVAQAHSDWQIAYGVFDHGGDPALGSNNDYKLCSDCNTLVTGSSPTERINSNNTLNGNSQWTAENIGIRVTSGNSLPDFVSERMYAFIYRDAGSGWGHRHAVLHEFTNDWGDDNTEGFIGVGIKEGSHIDICQFGCDDDWNLAKHITIDYYDPAGSAGGFSFKGLPIQLLAFEAKLKDNNVIINWSTLSEMNNDFFMVEKSYDGDDFQELERVTAAGNSKNQQDYYCYDLNPDIGVNYYRLKQVDFDGKSQYSKIISVVIDENTMAILSPNPFENYIYIKSNFLKNNTIQVFDLKGKIVYSSVLPSGASNTKIDLHKLEPGIYFVKIKGDNIKKTYKIIKI